MTVFVVMYSIVFGKSWLKGVFDSEKKAKDFLKKNKFKFNSDLHCWERTDMEHHGRGDLIATIETVEVQ